MPELTADIEARYTVNKDTWAYLHGQPTISATFKAKPEDFVVIEQLGFEPSGDGQHIALLVRKTNANTTWVAGCLADAVGIQQRDVGFAGQKDRNAVTTQWYTLDLAGKPAPDWNNVDIEGVEILQASPHRGKLKRGSNAANQFIITLRDVSPDNAAELNERIIQIQRTGAPNYYGSQRFGHWGDNVVQALNHLKPKGRKGLASNDMQLSALRSFLFNESLSQQVASGEWQRNHAQAQQDQRLQLNGTGSHFQVSAEDDLTDLAKRLESGDVHQTLALWSNRLDGHYAGEYQTNHPLIVSKLNQFRLGNELRASRLKPNHLQCSYDEAQQTLQLAFTLHAGQYATTLLREICELQEPERLLK